MIAPNSTLQNLPFRDITALDRSNPRILSFKRQLAVFLGSIASNFWYSIEGLLLFPICTITATENRTEINHVFVQYSKELDFHVSLSSNRADYRSHVTYENHLYLLWTSQRNPTCSGISEGAVWLSPLPLNGKIYRCEKLHYKDLLSISSTTANHC